MGMISTAVKHLIAAGMTGDDLVRAIEEIEAAASFEPAKEKQRSAAAIRQQRYRERHEASQTITRDVTNVTVTAAAENTPPPPLLPPQTPQTTPPPPEQKPRAREGTRLQADFDLPDEWKTWAMAEKRWSEADAIDEGCRFRDYWHGKPGKDGRKADWPATWRNWVRNSRRPAGDTGTGEFRFPDNRNGRDSRDSNRQFMDFARKHAGVAR